MKRPIVAVIVVAAGVLAACSGGTGTHTQSVGPDPTTSERTSPVTSPSSSETSSVRSTPSWSPPAYGRAQAAVEEYLAYIGAVHIGLADPARFNPATAAKVSAGEARQVLVGSIADEKRQGREWRGTPWPSRVLVVSTNFNSAAPEVVLSDCPAVNSSWTEYVVATGKPVPPARAPKVPPPYAATIKIFRVTGNKWVVTSYTTDGSRTCSR